MESFEVVENARISLYEIIGTDGKVDGVVTSSSSPEAVRDKIRNALKDSEQVTVDLSRMRSLSPSFAYQAFGLLVDEFGESTRTRIAFENDEKQLQTRITAAIDRRLKILEAQK